MFKNGPVVQLDRISDFGSEGWGFESSLGHYINSLQVLCNLFTISTSINYKKIKA